MFTTKLPAKMLFQFPLLLYRQQYVEKEDTAHIKLKMQLDNVKRV